ncbi:hypothetical protein PPL_08024 [Heterostelium album PN500]|uniref:Uncharacterized protein n=1 Tax=Heterostelium pallidum (strain ATCC 26659 / Pp 5 / PN500) TaxID=670386 RepID=D3BHM1_HETP5|nr:hypothetical protein PPL_08024 [Heterostelium album PN500]EFA79198.1 hypothetical protein PPL_08024 [Heterostelium album PN500]|eukprot:XP_020431319.1 hypothetical protein PPL_08024 [Heterostelium album PN500]
MSNIYELDIDDGKEQDNEKLVHAQSDMYPNNFGRTYSTSSTNSLHNYQPKRESPSFIHRSIENIKECKILNLFKRVSFYIVFICIVMFIVEISIDGLASMRSNLLGPPISSLILLGATYLPGLIQDKQSN